MFFVDFQGERMAEQSRVQPSRFEYDLDDGFDDLNEGFADLKMSDTFLDIGFGDESSGSQLQTVSRFVF